MQIFRFNVGLMLALSIFTSTVIPSNVQAVTLSEYKMTSKEVTSSVDEAFKKFQYAMSVEWDQKDEAFKKQAEKDLISALLVLIESGISAEEIQAHMEKTILSSESREEYKRLVAAMEGQDLPEEVITARTLEFVKNAQAKGLGFNGEGGPIGGHSTLTIVAVVIIVVVVTHLCLKGGRGDDHDHDYDHDYDYDHH